MPENFFADRRSLSQDTQRQDFFADRQTVSQPQGSQSLSNVNDPAPLPLPTAGREFIEREAANDAIRLSELIHTLEGQQISIGSGMIRAKNNIVQIGMDTLEAMGYADSGTADAFKQMNDQERAEFQSAFEKEFGNNFGFKVHEFVGEFGPQMVIAPGQASTKLGMLFTSSLVGFVTGFINSNQGDTISERADSRLKSGGIGATIGVGFQAGANTLNATRNFFRTNIQKAIEANRPFAERGLELQKRTGVTFKLSQLLDDPAVEDIERLARSSTTGERVARKIEGNQPKQILKFFLRTARNFSNRSRDFAGTVEKTFFRVLGDAKTGAGMLGRRARHAARDFGAAEKSGVLVSAQKTLGALDEMIKKAKAMPTNVNRRLAKELTDLRGTIMNKGGGLKPGELQDLLEQWGGAAKGTGRIFTDNVDIAKDKRIAKHIFGTLNDDLDEAVNSGIDGAKLLRKARDNYRDNTIPINELRDTVLGSLFGGKKDITVEGIEQAITKMKPSELRATLNILQQANPGMHRGLQRWWIERTISKARRSGDAASLQLDLNKMLNMADGDNKEIFNTIFSDAKARSQVRAGLDAVRRIILNNQSSQGGRLGNALKNAFGVAASMDKTFLARYGAEFFSPKIIGRLVTDPRGVEALEFLTKTRNTADITIIMNGLVDRYSED